MRHVRMACPALPLAAHRWLHRQHLLTDAEAARLLGLPDECTKALVLDRWDMLVPRAAEFMDAMTQVFRVRRVLACSSTAGRTLVRSRQFAAACLHRLLSTPRACVVSAETWLYAALQRRMRLGTMDREGPPNLGLVVALLVGDAESLSGRVRYVGDDGLTQVVLPASESATREWRKVMDDTVDAGHVFIELTKALAPARHTRVESIVSATICHMARRTLEVVAAIEERTRVVQHETQQLQLAIEHQLALQHPLA
jgi:hypothetical protein